jgi:hypothetical protein
MQCRNTMTTQRDYFHDAQVVAHGSIFGHREDLSSLYECLPAWKVNGIHVKLEDDCPQGNDDVRIFILRTLGAQNRRQVPCALCNRAITVYDRYPLLDGTFFVSPINQNNAGVSVRFESKPCFLLALCVHCMEAHTVYQCAICGSCEWAPWTRMIVGGLYTYDLLSCRACCQRCCRHCGAALPLNTAEHSYTAQCQSFMCSNCGVNDYHLLRDVRHEVKPSHHHRQIAQCTLSPTFSSSSGVSSDDAATTSPTTITKV